MKNILIPTFAAALCAMPVQAATITTSFGTTLAEVETGIGFAVSSTDAAQGGVSSVDFTSNNINAAGLTDGLFPTGAGSAVFQNNTGNGGPDPARFLLDLGGSIEIATINIFTGGLTGTSGDDIVRGGQRFTLFGSTLAASAAGFDETTFTEIGAVNFGTEFDDDGNVITQAGPANFGASSFSGVNQEFSSLLIVASLSGANSGGEGTIFQEVDVIAVVPEPSSTALLGLGALGLFIRRKR